MFVLKNVTANHRVNDAVFNEDGLQVVTGRFMYGPLDMVTLTGEKVKYKINFGLCRSQRMKTQLAHPISLTLFRKCTNLL